MKAINILKNWTLKLKTLFIWKTGLFTTDYFPTVLDNVLL